MRGLSHAPTLVSVGYESPTPRTRESLIPAGNLALRTFTPTAYEPDPMTRASG